MPMIWGGPSLYHNRSHRWLSMGPVLLLRHDADGMGWAHSSSQDMWSINLNGPSVGAGSDCRWHGVDSLFLRNMASIIMNGLWDSAEPCGRSHWIEPVLQLSHFADGMGWAHCFSEGILSMSLSWPSYRRITMPMI